MDGFLGKLRYNRYTEKETGRPQTYTNYTLLFIQIWTDFKG